MFTEKYFIKALVFFCFVFLCYSCTTIAKKVSYTQEDLTPEISSKIRRDVVDKTIEVGTNIGYTPLDQDYNRGYVKLQRRWGPGGFAPVTWTIVVSCSSQGNSVIAHIYTPDDAPDVKRFHEKLMSLY